MRAERHAHDQQRDDRAEIEPLRYSDGDRRREHHHRDGEHQMTNVQDDARAESRSSIASGKTPHGGDRAAGVLRSGALLPVEVRAMQI